MQDKYTTDDVVVMLNGKQCVGFGEYTDSETQLLVNEGFMQMARNVNELLQQRSELLEALSSLTEVADAAIILGDWKVDGRCDPDSAIRHARELITKVTA